MGREGRREPEGRLISRQRETCVVASVNLLKLVGVEPQMSELMQYALVHHTGKSLVPETRN